MNGKIMRLKKILWNMELLDIIVQENGIIDIMEYIV